MALQPPNSLSRERILSYGGAGLGKSFDFYTIARLAAKSGSDAKFYIIDTDESVGRMVTDPDMEVLFGDDGELRNIVPVDVEDWPTLIAAMESIRAKMRPQDWLMIDMVTPTWQWVQDDFTNRAYKQDRSDYFIERRAAQVAANKEGKLYEGNNDWVFINNEYGKFQKMVLKWPGNLYCTAEGKALDNKNADKETKLLFGAYGVVPAGQKRMPFLFHTVILKTAFKQGEFMMTTPKNRSRELLTSQPVTDFSVNYLVQNGKWKLA